MPGGPPAGRRERHPFGTIPAFEHAGFPFMKPARMRCLRSPFACARASHGGRKPRSL